MTLRRLVLDFTGEGIEIRTLYRTKQCPNPGTKARRREVTELTREGLSTALEALERRVDVIGTSGYDVRQDVLLATTSPVALETGRTVKMKVKGA
jgi:hypothetical protein